MIETIELSKITADESAQPRCAINVDGVAEYTEDMDRGDIFPPLVVFHDGKRYWLADGFHRFYAAIHSGRHEIECGVREGGLRDAILHSCGANAQHGLRRTNNDKRRAVLKLVEDPIWTKLENREIARRCAVSHAFVNQIRKELQELLETVSTNQDESEIDETPYGSVDGPLIADCLREVLLYMDLMPTPKDAVRHFPEDRRYLFSLDDIEAAGQWLVSFVAFWRERIRKETLEKLEETQHRTPLIRPPAARPPDTPNPK
jgi:hypothetical protein